VSSQVSIKLRSLAQFPHQLSLKWGRDALAWGGAGDPFPDQNGQLPEFNR
jgi:hypothetical protein